MIRILVVEDNEKEMSRCKALSNLASQEISFGSEKMEGEEIEFVFAINFKEAISLLPTCQAVMTDLYFPGPSIIDKEQLAEALRKYPYCSDIIFSEEIPFGLLIALRARKENKPVMFVSAGAHHSSASNFLTMMCREDFFEEGLFFEGISSQGYKQWLRAFSTVINHSTWLYWAKYPVADKLSSTFYGKPEKRPEDETLQTIADTL